MELLPVEVVGYVPGPASRKFDCLPPMTGYKGALVGFALGEGIFTIAQLELYVRISLLCPGFGMLPTYIHEVVPVSVVASASAEDMC